MTGGVRAMVEARDKRMALLEYLGLEWEPLSVVSERAGMPVGELSGPLRRLAIDGIVEGRGSARLREYRRVPDDAPANVAALRADALESRRQRDVAVEALERFGRHFSGCSRDPRCTCGLDATLKAVTG